MRADQFTGTHARGSLPTRPPSPAPHQHGTHVALPATPPIPLPEGPVDIVVLEDHGLLEIFLAGGTVAVTMQTFKHDGPVRLSQQA